MSCEKLAEKLSSLEGKVAITSFGNPDPDAIASAYALSKIFEARDIDYDFRFEIEITRPENQLLVNYLEMEIGGLGENWFREHKNFSLVDCNPTRIMERTNGKVGDELYGKLLSVQDHHNVDESQLEFMESEGVYVDIRTELGSCSTILAECIRDLELEFDEKTATALYYGLHSDTRGLLRSFTDFDLKQASIYAGKIDHESLEGIVGAVMTSETFEVIHRVTDEDLYEVRGTYKFANAGTLTRKNRSAIPQVADLLLREEGLDGIVVSGIDLEDNLVIGSVRYSGSRYSAEEIATKIAEGVGSGGGHVEMGGFQINPGVLGDTLQRKSSQDALMESIKERFFNVVGKRSDD